MPSIIFILRRSTRIGGNGVSLSARRAICSLSSPPSRGDSPGHRERTGTAVISRRPALARTTAPAEAAAVMSHADSNESVSRCESISTWPTPDSPSRIWGNRRRRGTTLLAPSRPCRRGPKLCCHTLSGDDSPDLVTIHRQAELRITIAGHTSRALSLRSDYDPIVPAGHALQGIVPFPSKSFRITRNDNRSPRVRVDHPCHSRLFLSHVVRKDDAVLIGDGAPVRAPTPSSESTRPQVDDISPAISGSHSWPQSSRQPLRSAGVRCAPGNKQSSWSSPGHLLVIFW